MKQKEGDNVAERCRAWYDLCHGKYQELIDCRTRHERFHQMRLFKRTIKMRAPINVETTRPPMQETWRRLIRLLLAYEGKRCDNDAVGDYQCENWGAEDGETCVVELSALAANSILIKRDRKRFRDDRVTTLAQRLEESGAKFAVLYGLECRDDFEVIAGGPFDELGYRWRGGTLCVLATHPVTHGVPDSWWIAKGQEMRRLVDGCRGSIPIAESETLNH